MAASLVLWLSGAVSAWMLLTLFGNERQRQLAEAEVEQKRSASKAQPEQKPVTAPKPSAPSKAGPAATVGQSSKST